MLKYVLVLLSSLFLFSCVGGEEVIGEMYEFGNEEPTPILKGDGSCNCSQSGIDEDCYYEYQYPVNACWLDRYDDDNAIIMTSVAGIISDGAEIDLYCAFDTPYEYLNGSDEMSVRTYGDSTYSYVFVYASHRAQSTSAYSDGSCNFYGNNTSCRIDGINPSTSYQFWGVRVRLPWQVGYRHGVDGFRVCYDND